MTIGTAKPVLVQSSLVGGASVPFDDANAVAQWPAQVAILADRPIAQIDIRSGWIVDNITITYNLANGTKSSPIVHGGTGGGAASIPLGQYEIISSIQGKAGNHSYYGRPYVCSISFTILDTQSLVTRTTSVYGNGDGANQGDPFQVAQPYALAGATYTDGQTGVAGLSVFKLITNV